MSPRNIILEIWEILSTFFTVSPMISLLGMFVEIMKMTYSIFVMIAQVFRA